MGTVNQLLALAEQQLGNGGAKYWNWYRDHYAPTWGGYVDGNATPYCACFDTWLLDKTSTPCVFFPRAYAFDWREIAERDRVGKYDLKPGDMISFDWDDDWRGDHVGVVKSVQQWGCVTYEGNTGSEMRVQERQRLWDVILFGIRPDYESEDEMTSAEWTKLEKMLDKKIESALGRVGGKVWSFRNSKLEEVDAYQILRDMRTSLGVNDGQKLNEYCVTFAQGVIAKICDALGIKR